ncbi:MAG TPA: ATP-binding protein [Candidatus Merdousia gallistercoris]|nr:ATP-binding protein [Candidatus Merdousia gallistercoris]
MEEKKYRLNIDPRILELLGPNLYTNIYYILAELIANAYDADANNVYIISDKDSIIVEDDGIGMSYKKKEVDKFLRVAAISRTNDSDSFSSKYHRAKMGRKGVGKLAALSISENVEIMTVSNGEKSGFILSRHPNENNELTPIPDADIKFRKISSHGTAIVMKNPQYRLHNTLDAIKHNLTKIFPLVSNDFKIHITIGTQNIEISDFDKNIMDDLCSIITLGDRFKDLSNLVPSIYPDKKNELIISRPAKEISATLKDNNGDEHEYTVKIEGWIGTYKTTRGRKLKPSDFPDNFISLFANNKMGEFNILPSVGQNKLAEVYVVGQLHADIFELSELPDMALSNRQGYKSDDERYILVRDYIRNELLPEVLKQRSIYTDRRKKDKEEQNEKKMLENEKKLKEEVDKFREAAIQTAVKEISKFGNSPTQNNMETAIKNSFNVNAPKLGIKGIVDSQKKKILISQTEPDKPVADILYQMLIYNGIPSEDILYSNCDDEAARIPEGEKIYEYLRKFFVDTYSTQKIYVLFVTSMNTRNSWGAITEVGAAWITQIKHKIFNVHPFRPEHPLDDESEWQITNRDDKGDLSLTRKEADKFCVKVENVCKDLGYKNKTRSENISRLGTLIAIV